MTNQVPDDTGVDDLTPIIAHPPRTLDDVVKALYAVVEKLSELTGYGRRTRRLALALLISFVLDIALTATVTFLTINALHRSNDLRTAQLTACAIGNETRHEQITLWTTLFLRSEQLQKKAGKPISKSQQKIDNEFLGFVDKTFTPVNCTQLYGN